MVILGKKEDLFSRFVEVIDMNWLSVPPRYMPFDANAKFRYSQKEFKVKVIPLSEKRILIELNTPISSVSPGQATVLYEKDVILGGGWIDNVYPTQKKDIQL